MPDSLLSLPPIETARCRIAPLRPEDDAAFQALTNDPIITDAVSFLEGGFTLDEARALIAKQVNGEDAFLGIRHRASDALAGMIGAHLHGLNTIEIGYWIGAGFRGQGYATEAGAGLIAALRRGFPHRRIIAECRPENRASWRVLTKLGFTPTGAEGLRVGRKLLALA
jgi:RimJ/RimL family protein N-acetyltransferase